MFSGGLNKLDGWKDLKQVDGAAERRHEEVAKVRAEGETLHGRLDQAFKKHQQTNLGVKESVQPKVGEKVAGEGIGQQTTDHGQRTNNQSLAHNVKPTVAASPSTPPSQIYKTPNSLPVNSGKQPPHVLQVSNFLPPVPNAKQPQLANLLRGSNTPPVPPKIEDKKPLAAKEGVEIKKEILESPAGRVQGPVTPDAGAKLASATKEEKGDVGKKKEEKKSEGGEKAKGKGALASARADGSQGKQKLEAAAGGVAGESSEPPCVADRETGVTGFNTETAIEKNYLHVSEGAALYRRYILKSSDIVSAVLENAWALNNNTELNQALKQGLAGRTYTVYGKKMTRG